MSFRIFDDAMRVVIRAVWQIEERMRQFMAESFPLVLFSVAFVGVGSSVLHPESSKVARLASGGAKGMAQSIFQIGGNVGRAIGPVAVALIVIPHGQGSIRWFALLAVVAIWLLAKIGSWYKKQIALYGRSKSKYDMENVSRLSRHQIISALLVLLVLMFSKDFYTANLCQIQKFIIAIIDL